MVSPQKENGHIDIANEIAEALMKINLSSYESRVLWFILRKTWGWHKKMDWLTLSQFSKAIGLDRRLIHRALKRLSSKKMIVINRDDNNRISYGFQKNYDKWKVSSKEMTVINIDDGLSSVEMTQLSSVEMNTKETITKETITKEKCPRFKFSEHHLNVAKLLEDEIKERLPRHKLSENYLERWANVVRLMEENGEAKIEEIKNIILWLKKDDFWYKNILSMEKLRKQFGRLWAEMNEVRKQTGEMSDEEFEARQEEALRRGGAHPEIQKGKA